MSENINNPVPTPEGHEDLGFNYNDPNIGQYAPRFDLREKAFRNYERYIVRAFQEGSYTIDPAKERLRADKRAINARSFCIRFRDAILGFTRYNYHCDAIPAGTNLSHIKARELMNGFVRIVNLMKDTQMLSGGMLASDWNTVILAVEKMHKFHMERPYDPCEEIVVHFNTQEEQKKILELEDEYGVSPKLTQPGCYLIRF